jgi:hypothetical protein
MKNSALQQTRAYVYDNKQFIEGNISEHLLNNLYSNDIVLFEYLTDEEIEECYQRSGITKSSKQFEAEVEFFIIKNFNFNIQEFEY